MQRKYQRSLSILKDKLGFQETLNMMLMSEFTEKLREQTKMCEIFILQCQCFHQRSSFFVVSAFPSSVLGFLLLVYYDSRLYYYYDNEFNGAASCGWLVWLVV